MPVSIFFLSFSLLIDVNLLEFIHSFKYLFKYVLGVGDITMNKIVSALFALETKGSQGSFMLMGKDKL